MRTILNVLKCSIYVYIHSYVNKVYVVFKCERDITCGLTDGQKETESSRERESARLFNPSGTPSAWGGAPSSPPEELLSALCSPPEEGLSALCSLFSLFCIR